MDVWDRNFQILRPFVTEDIDDAALKAIEKTFAFPAQRKVQDGQYCLAIPWADAGV